MKPCLNRPESNLPESNLIRFMSIREPESIYLNSYQELVAMGIRHGIAHSLASYAAFQEKKFDSKSPLLVHVREEIGQEPMEQGRMAA